MNNITYQNKYCSKKNNNKIIIDTGDGWVSRDEWYVYTVKLVCPLFREKKHFDNNLEK